MQLHPILTLAAFAASRASWSLPAWCSTAIFGYWYMRNLVAEVLTDLPLHQIEYIHVSMLTITTEIDKLHFKFPLLLRDWWNYLMWWCKQIIADTEPEQCFLVDLLEGCYLVWYRCTHSSQWTVAIFSPSQRSFQWGMMFHSSGVVLSTEGTLTPASTQPTRRCMPILVRSEWLLLTRSFHHTVQPICPRQNWGHGTHCSTHSYIQGRSDQAWGGAKVDIFQANTFPEESSHQRMKAGSFCWPFYGLTCVNSA